MSTKAKRHTHKYHQIQIANTWVWACALPNCNHYMPKHMEAMVPGKNSVCWMCLKDFVLDEKTMEIQKPFCKSCLTKLDAPLVIESPNPNEPPLVAIPTDDGGIIPICHNCKIRPAMADSKICHTCFLMGYK